MNIESVGLRICVASGEVAPSMALWYSEVNHLFEIKYWVACCFASTPFGGGAYIDDPYDYNDELIESLIFKKPPNIQSEPIIFKPEAMSKYYEFVHNDWVELYGIPEHKINDVLKKWESNDIRNFLLEFADPYIHNCDGWWWDIFSSEIGSVRRCLVANKEIKVEDVTINESLIN